MPRIPRRWKGDEETAPPEEQSGAAPTSPDGSPAPAPAAPTSGDPLAPPPSEPADAPTAGGSATSAADPSWPAPAPPEPAPATADEPPTAAAPPGTDQPTTPFPAAEAAAAEASTTESPSAIDAPGAPADQPTTPFPAAEPGGQPTVAATPVAMTSGDPLGGVTGPTSPEGEQAAPQGELVVVEEEAPEDARPGFRQRTRMRRRLRYLRRLRELAFRDLGGLVFDLHRFGRDRADLVAAKLEALTTIDRELRTLQDALQERKEFTDLREAGIAACPRCGTLHDTDANFCPGCGTSLRTAIVRDAAPVTVTPADTPAPAASDEPEQQPTVTGS